MYCPSCGTLNNEENFRCSSCGNMLPQPQQQQPQQQQGGWQQQQQQEQGQWAQPQQQGQWGQQGHQQGQQGYGQNQNIQAPHHGPMVQAGYPAGSTSNKSKVVAGLLQIFITFGIGRFYLGYNQIGIWQLVTTLFCGVGALWCLIDGILILTGSVSTDADGRPLSN